MTIRRDVSVIQNKFHDAQLVDQTDMGIEQEFYNQTHAGLVQNHFGTGVLLETPTQPVLFDSDNLTDAQASILAAGNFDGQGLSAHAQPSDINLGNQLEVELTNSNVIGHLSTKVAIIGLDFDGNLKTEKFVFFKNEKQVTSRHYKRIISILFNDFKGNNNCSRNLGGTVVIKEVKSFQISRDPIMVAQDLQPDIFWRDWKTTDVFITLNQSLQTALGSEYTVASLDITTTGLDNKVIEAGNVVTQYGQKFKTTTGNIQKISLLLGASENTSVPIANRYDWDGDLVVSLYALQTSVAYSCAILPSLAIDFEPNYAPIAQITYSQAELKDIGYVLTDILQPVDFVFSATKLSSDLTSTITVGNYYVVTIKRAGAATTGDILIGVGSDKLDDSRATAYNGVWVDITDEDLWFQVYTDAAKICTGMGYDNGNGMQYDKTVTDAATGASIDNEILHKEFTDTGEDVLNIGILQAIDYESVKSQDERSGSPINSRKQKIPSFSFVTSSELTDLQDTSEPLIVGCMKDSNPKTWTEFTKTQSVIGLARSGVFCVINPDADLLSINLMGSKLTPNILTNYEYRVTKIEYCQDGYGDVNGDGIIDATDSSLVAMLVGESLYYSSTQQKIIDGYFSSPLEIIRADLDGDGYVTANDLDLITKYINKEINSFPVGSYFTHICFTLEQSINRSDGYFDCSDGYIRTSDGYYSVIDGGVLTTVEKEYYGYIEDVMLETDVAFSVVPFVAVDYKFTPMPYWKPQHIIENSDARLVPVMFSYPVGVDEGECSAVVTSPCTDRSNPTVSVDVGRNDFYVPNNLIIGNGQIIRPDGNLVRPDIEVGIITLYLPDTPLATVSLNVFDKLVADHGGGKTTAQYTAMKYSDCTYVQPEDLAAGNVKFGVALSAIAKNVDGYDDDGYYIIANPDIGVQMLNSTGILVLTASDLEANQLIRTLVTKVEITVYLKKSGWLSDNYKVISENEVIGLLSS